MKPVYISDHVILRYLERVKGVDVEAARAAIVEIVGPAAAAGATRFTSSGLTYRMDNGRVSTVVVSDSPGSGKPRRSTNRKYDKALRREEASA